MPDYKEGKIYTIRSPNTDKYYIGSTTQPLHKRFYKHKKTYENGTNTTTATLVLEYVGAYIELLELCSCNSRDELSKREGELQREHKDKLVNKNTASITPEEFKEYQTKYHQENKERLAIEMKKYRDNNKEKNLKRREANREKAREYAKKYREKKSMSIEI
jgi:hypothetical protein